MANKVLKGSANSDTITVGGVFDTAYDNYTIYGYGGHDDIFVNAFADAWIDAAAGNDKIEIKGYGDHTVYGGSGDDEINHSDFGVNINGVAKLYGGTGNDTMGMLEDDSAWGGSGDDVYDTTYGFALVDEWDDVTITEYAGDGYDTIIGSFSVFNFANAANIERYEFKNFNTNYSGEPPTVMAITITGDARANSVSMSRGNDYAKMNDGNDDVDGAMGHDTIYGDAGHDSIYGGGDDDYLHGGTGDDVIVGDDWKYYNQSDNVGYDTIYGMDGNDQLFGGKGTDYLSGGAGNDLLVDESTGFGFNTLVGGTGNDTYRINWQNTLVENYGEGIDTIELIGGGYFTISANIEHLSIIAHPMPYSGSTPIKLTNVITGNALANTITALDVDQYYEDPADTFYGMEGADILDGKFGNDKLYGGIHDDRVYGGEGNDSLYGEDGYDKVYGGDGNDLMSGGNGNDELGGNNGADYITGDGGDDVIYAGADADFVSGGDGYDTIYGESGNDVLKGGTMNDYLYGGDNDDALYGEAGSDFLWGNAGNDRFVYTNVAHSRIGDGIDQIKDFLRGADKIDLSAIDANSLVSGNQAFTWAGLWNAGSMPAPKAGNLWGQKFEANAYNPEFIRVYADVNGDGTADMSVDVMGQTTMYANDFLL